MGISCTVASNTLIYEWSGIVQWIHDRIKQEQRGKQQQRKQQQQRFLSEKLTQDATHVLTFLQQCHRDDDDNTVVVHRSFLCKVEDGGGDTSIVLDLHTMPVNFASVCFVKAVDIARRCLERRLLSILFVEEIAAKVAYLELSNVFTLLDEKVTWVVDDDDGGEGGGDNSVTTTRKRRPKLMVSTQFDADAFCEAFNRMHHVVVNEYKVYLQSPQFSIDDGGANDGVVGGDFVSHLNCMHVRLEPDVLHQNYIIPHSVVNLVCRECLSSPTAAIVTPRGVRYHHFCTILPTNLLYASRSFLISYDLDNGEDRDLSKEHLILSTENVCGFFFYSIAAAADPDKSSVATTTGGGGKSIKGYRDEAYANLEKFMDLQVSKCEEDKRSSTCQRLKANELRKYLSRISQPLKKVNNDKGEIRNRNYACALAELSVRGFYEKYLRDCQTLYELDLVERQGEPHTSQVAKSADHMRCPMPSQLTVSRDFLERLDAYFKQNQRFKKDKNRNSIQVSILPDEDDDAWLNGWYVSVNAREFCHQLASINYRARSGDRFDLRQRNEVCFSSLFRMFDWSIYKEDIKNVIAISVHERKLRAAPSSSVVRPSPPFNATLRLDQFFDRDELTAISLLLVASFHHVCKCEEEYCHLRVTPRPLLVPPRDDDDKEASSSRKRMRDGGELPKR